MNQFPLILPPLHYGRWIKDWSWETEMNIGEIWSLYPTRTHLGDKYGWREGAYHEN